MPLVRVPVNKKALRKLFNEGGFYAKTQTGEFIEEVVYDDLPSARSNQTSGTRSQRVTYTEANTGRYVATVHQFLHRDGTIGASGMPDPQRLRVGNTLYIISTSEIPQD